MGTRYIIHALAPEFFKSKNKMKLNSSVGITIQESCWRHGRGGVGSGQTASRCAAGPLALKHDTYSTGPTMCGQRYDKQML